MAAPCVYRLFTIISHRRIFYKKLVKKCFHLKRWQSTDVIYSLKRRGVVGKIFPEGSEILTHGMPCAYAGFDPTSDSLHIGNLLILIALMHWRRAGNNAIVVIGDATAQVGDPSGHKTDRDRLAEDKILSNAESIEKSIHRILDNYQNFIRFKKSTKNKCATDVRILRNSEWYAGLSAIDFITGPGRHLRMSDMLSRTSVKTRLESREGINFSEFTYQLFQAYDWLHLYDKYKCQFQFGGNDQLGNIVSGHRLIHCTHYKTVYGILTPLIESETGDKYGKSGRLAVYLNEDKTTSFDLYQFFMRIHDTEVEKFLKLFTFLSTDEIEDIVEKHMKNPSKRLGQKKIADEMLLLVHGEKGLEMAQRASDAFYNSNLDSLQQMSVTEMEQVLPRSSFVELLFEPGTSLLDLTLKAKCFRNEADARRIIAEGGVQLNFQKSTSLSMVITPGVHILSNGTTLIRIGYKRL